MSHDNDPGFIANDKENWWGRVVESEPYPFYIVRLLFFMLFLCALTILVFGQYARKEEATGVIHSITAFADVPIPQSGIIEKIQIKPGQHVGQNQVLATVAVPDPEFKSNTFSIAALRKKKRKLQSRIDLVKVEYKSIQAQLTKAIDSYEAEIAALIAEKPKIERLALIASKRFEVIKDFYDDGLEAINALQRAEEVVLQAELNRVRHAQTTHRRRGQQEDRKREKEEMRASHDDRIFALEAELSETRVQLERMRDKRHYEVLAPRSGIIETVLLKNGDIGKQSSILAIMRPEEEEFKGMLAVPSSTVGFLKEGASIVYEIDAFPRRKFGAFQGTIKSVSRTSVAVEDFAKVNRPEDDRYYLVEFPINDPEIEAYGGDWNVRDGMTIRTSIMLEKQSLLRWVLDPVFLALDRNPQFLDRVKAFLKSFVAEVTSQLKRIMVKATPLEELAL